jgi:ATP-dependent Lon protease
VLPTRDAVLLPEAVIELLVGRAASVTALRRAERGDGRVVVLLQTDPAKETPGPSDLHRVGTIATPVDGERVSTRAASVTLQGLQRVRVVSLELEGEALMASVEAMPWTPVVPPLSPDLLEFITLAAQRGLGPQLSARAQVGLPFQTPEQMLCAISCVCDLKPEALQAVLESGDLSPLADSAAVLRAEVNGGPLGRGLRRFARWIRGS